MKFCYVDESGMGTEPFLVMSGVIVDGQRMRVTKEDWTEILGLSSKVCRREVKEFHTREFYAGNGPWRGTDGKHRAEVLGGILEWWRERKHHVTFSAIDKETYAKVQKAGELPQGCETPWRMAALHVVLTLQKHHQGLGKNKGHTVLLFDREGKEEAELANLVATPPDWMDDCYGRRRKDEPLNQVIDVPFFGDSQHVLLLQVADLISYVLRRYVEVVQGGGRGERYEGERARLDQWMRLIESRCLPVSTRWATKGQCAAGKLFSTLAPATLRDVGRVSTPVAVTTA